MKWSFSIDITEVKDCDFYKKIVEKAEESVYEIGKSPSSSTFKVSIIFFQKKNRWQKGNPRIPREDSGRDLDNLIKPVFDALGPIIGYRKKWEKRDTGKYVEAGKRKAADSKIVELTRLPHIFSKNHKN